MLTVLLMLMVPLLTAGQQARSVYQVIAERPELTEFLKLVESDSLMLEIMRQEEGTVFAPNNDAMNKYTGERDYQLLKYHMVNMALPVEELVKRRTVLTRLKGSQEVYVTELPGFADLLINNARLVGPDHRGSSEQDAQPQVLHIIDEVLEPTIPNNRDSNLYNPNALELLANSDKYSFTQATASKFYSKVRQLQKDSVFNTQGYHTYFIPVDQHFDETEDRVDRTVVDMHVIPNVALFTRGFSTDSYQTMAYGDMLKANLRLLTHQRSPPDGRQPYHEAQSTILVGDAVHEAGSTLVNIVRPNIAVKNGVIHLVRRPLGVQPESTFRFIENRAGDSFSEFFRLLESEAPDHIQTLRTVAPESALFMPSNEAFFSADQKRLEEVKQDPERLRSLLKLHVAKDQVTTYKVREAPKSKLYKVPAFEKGSWLYLAITNDSVGQATMTVEGGGTNASVLVADLTARDGGVVHIIDKLLGIPYRSVAEKLDVDAMMSQTALLARQNTFDENVSQMDRKFTMFVPSNDAWRNLNMSLPTSHLNLFSGRASYQGNRILERHLVVGGAYSVAQLANLTEVHGAVRTYRGNFTVLKAPTTEDYIVRWQSKQARIIRTNIECTNGIIHVIDNVMMRARDVKTSKAPAMVASAAGRLLAALVLIYLGL